MDKRRRATPDRELESQIRTAFYAAVSSGSLSVGQAVAAMRRISRLTQPEFAKRRGLSLRGLRLIEADKANPTVETLNKIVDIYGLQVGFVPRGRPSITARDLERVGDATRERGDDDAT